MDPENAVISHEGIVTKNSGESVTVSILATTACSGCHAKGSCNMLGSEQKIVEVNGKYNVSPGDTVHVLMKQSMGFTALFFGYLLPFVAVLIMLITLISVNTPELTAGLISLSVLLPYYLILYFSRKRMNEKFTFTLKV